MSQIPLKQARNENAIEAEFSTASSTAIEVSTAGGHLAPKDLSLSLSLSLSLFQQLRFAEKSFFARAETMPRNPLFTKLNCHLVGLGSLFVSWGPGYRSIQIDYRQTFFLREETKGRFLAGVVFRKGVRVPVVRQEEGTVQTQTSWSGHLRVGWGSST